MKETLLSEQLNLLNKVANWNHPIDGNIPQIKGRFLVSCLSVGMEIAYLLGLESPTGTIFPGNDGTSGEVEVYGKAPGSDFVVRIHFCQPILGRTMWRVVGGNDSMMASFSVKVEPFGEQVPVVYRDLARSFLHEVNYIRIRVANSVRRQLKIGEINNRVVDKLLAGEFDE